MRQKSLDIVRIRVSILQKKSSHQKEKRGEEVLKEEKGG